MKETMGDNLIARKKGDQLSLRCTELEKESEKTASERSRPFRGGLQPTKGILGKHQAQE